MCFTDLETGGTDEQNHPIIELGAVRVDYPVDYFKKDYSGDPPEMKELSSKISPTGSVDPGAAEVNGYIAESWANAPSLEQVLRQYYGLLKNARFAGWNPDFDRSFIRREFNYLHWSWPYRTGYRMMDVQSLAFPFTCENFEDPYRVNLEMIAKKAGILKEDEKQEHSGLFDAHLARKVYEFMMRRQFGS